MSDVPPVLVALRQLAMRFPAPRSVPRVSGQWVHAVDDVSLQIRRGETLGLVGESGCGKSTLARCVVRLLEPSDGRIIFDGRDITHLPMRALRPLRARMQMVFQDPMSSLNPLKPAGRIVADALSIRHRAPRAERGRRVTDLLGKVGLLPEHAERLPHELSGGQRQRVGIARALAPGPDLVVADEPVSALDVSVQAEILNLLGDLRAEYGITYLFISHDLGVIRQVADRVGVMYLGKLVEVAPAERFFEHPVHRYSEALLASVPNPDPGTSRRPVVLGGEVPGAVAPPSGCRFHPRCQLATGICRREEPPMLHYGPDHLAACHHPAGD